MTGTRMAVTVAALNAMREAARKEVASTTLNGVAAKVGVDGKALVRFLQGGDPSPVTHTRLLDWYLASRRVQAEETARCAVGILLGHAEPHAFQRTARELLEVIARAPGDRPPWLGELLAEMASVEEDDAGGEEGGDGSLSALEALIHPVGEPEPADVEGAPIPLEGLRSAVRDAVRRRSARAVAAEIGISHRGLGYFLNGGQPRRSTARTLRMWYVRHGAAVDGRVTAELARAAMDALLELVPAHVRDRARGELITVLSSSAERGCATTGV